MTEPCSSPCKNRTDFSSLTRREESIEIEEVVCFFRARFYMLLPPPFLFSLSITTKHENVA